MELRKGITSIVFPLIEGCRSAFQLWKTLNDYFGNEKFEFVNAREHCAIGCSEVECNLQSIGYLLETCFSIQI